LLRSSLACHTLPLYDVFPFFLLSGQLLRGGGVERHCGAYPFRGGGVFRDRRSPCRLSEARSAVHARIVPHAPPRMSPSRDTPGPLPAASRDPVPVATPRRR